MSIFGGDRHKLGEYVRDMADLMGLRDWMIRVCDEPLEDKTAAGHCNVPYGRRIGNITFAHDWMDYDPGEFRTITCHELIHCHAAAMTWATNNVQLIVPNAMFLVFEGAFNDALEIMVDSMAMAWAETLPLPAEAAEATDEQEAA